MHDVMYSHVSSQLTLVFVCLGFIANRPDIPYSYVLSIPDTVFLFNCSLQPVTAQ